MYKVSSVMNTDDISSAILRMSQEIIDNNKDHLDSLAFIGIKKGGDILAKRFIKIIKKLSGQEAFIASLDISLYRDDFNLLDENLVIGETDIKFDVSRKNIILVDDVLQTGRTIRAALDQIIDFGRPSRIELAVLVERGGREFPIAPDYCGKVLTFQENRYIQVKLEEGGFGKDEVLSVVKK